MTTIERLGNAARWATVWGNGDVTHASLMTVNPIIVLALLDVAETVNAFGITEDFEDEEPDLPDSTLIEWEVTLGSLRALRAALARLGGAS